MSLSAVQTLVDSLVRDVGDKVSPTQRDDAIALAVTRYSQDRPDAIVEDVTSPGGQALTTLPVGWIARRSTILNIEYPLGNVPPTNWASSESAVYMAPGGEVIHLAYSLGVGEVVRVTYGVPHRLSPTEDTLPDAHREAVGYYAAAALCDQLAAEYADNTMPQISADRVDQGAQNRAWRAMAKDYRARYGEIVGLPSGDAGGGNYVAPAATVINHDMVAADGKRPLWRRR